MKKVQTSYSFTKKDESITIKVVEDCGHLDYKPIMIEEQPCWRKPEEAVEYYEWIAECIKKLVKIIYE
jgi:hypothetical protein